ncbi:hypothetical protein C8035_v010319 [Colletotrichum spinosum]|uniref:Uncharacterized protein n=1 Tax=Colletotrichum spinosum TaxID=1347390 RepID=A0A4R8Q7R4_9PEZI|nr:hypothetical protein C8035_v010319 [Colletotrichum spinosum]
MKAIHRDVKRMHRTVAFPKLITQRHAARNLQRGIPKQQGPDQRISQPARQNPETPRLGPVGGPAALPLLEQSRAWPETETSPYASDSV